MSAAPAVVSGRVVDEDESPVPRARVAFVSGPEPLPDIAAVTNDVGAFTLSARLTGVYELECFAEGFYPSRLRVKLSNGKTVQVTFRLTHAK